MKLSASVTGFAVLAPGANCVDDLWSNVCAGRSAIKPVPELASLPVAFAGVCPRTCEELGFKQRSMDRHGQLAVVAAREAVEDAKLLERVEPHRIGVVVGTGGAGIETFEAQLLNLEASGPRAVNPYTLPMVLANSAAAAVSRELGASGPTLGLATACSSGADAIVEGVRLLVTGEADAVVCGGTESTLTRAAVVGFLRMGVLSVGVEAPERSSRPFDRDRNGFVMAEGAGMVVLERSASGADHEVLGFGQTADAYHIAAPRKDGVEIERAMVTAIESAGLVPSDIAAVKAHGTSTQLNDAVEATALCHVFGGRTPLVTAPKGAIGHTLGASGAIELCLGLLIARTGSVPPIANLDDVDDETPEGLDLVRGEARQVAPGPVLCNSFGFGGHNTSIVVRVGVTG